jgi:predicted enzyme related to lactoylglutathione lyase
MSAAVVHLELHTDDSRREEAFYERLLGWRPETVQTAHGSYAALDLGEVGGGVVECGATPAVWIPYVAVDDVHARTARACGLGATVMLAPREGPAGWRSVVTDPRGATIALWQAKR